MTAEPTTPLPESPYCRVRARVASIWADGPDAGTSPDWRPAVGEKVTLAPSIGAQLLVYDVAGPEPIIVTVERVQCEVDADGWLVKADGRPVYIAPTDDPRLSATGWTWTATIKGKSIPFPAPAGGVVNLALYIDDLAVDATERISVVQIVADYIAANPPDVEQAVADYLTANPPAAAPDATTAAKGLVRLAGDLGGTATAPTVPGLASKADADHDHDGTYAPVLDPDDNYVTDAEKAALHSHANKAALDAVSGVNTGDQDLSGYATTGSLAGVATSGSYADLTNKPTIPDSPDDIGAAPVAHDHTAADIDSGAAADGHVLTADGAGGAAWGAPPAGDGGGGGAVGVTADDTPAAPAEGESASYFVSSAVTWPAGLVWSTDPDGGVAPTIDGTALVSMFTVDGTTRAIMGATFPAPPDTTTPVAGTLAVVPSSTSALGTVTGASDTEGLDAEPYSFRLDAGAWSAWQASASYTWIGLTASTSYTFQHRVRDAAGNITEGTAVTATTDAPAVDSTPPTVGNMTVSSISASGFTVTITGAADETALDAAPYAFTTDGGTTWTAYQASATYTATGLTAETAYTVNWRVKDEAGNVSTGTAQTVTTPAAVTILASDTFNRANGALGSSDGPGALPWSPGSMTFSIVSNQAYAGGASSRAAINVGQTDHKVKVTVANALPGGVILRGNADSTSYWRVIWFNDGNWYITAYPGTIQHRHTWAQAAPAIGDTLAAQAVTNGASIDFKVWHNDTLVQEYTETNAAYVSTSGTYAGIFGVSSAALLDDFEVTTPV